jgi:hypothetical protein
VCYTPISIRLRYGRIVGVAFLWSWGGGWGVDEVSRAGYGNGEESEENRVEEAESRWIAGDFERVEEEGGEQVEAWGCGEFRVPCAPSPFTICLRLWYVKYFVLPSFCQYLR